MSFTHAIKNGGLSLSIAAILTWSIAVAKAAVVEGVALAEATAHVDWDRIIEKGGTVAILIWMLLYFQKRLEAVTLRSELFADKALTLLEKASLVMVDVAKSQNDMRVAIEALTNRLSTFARGQNHNQITNQGD